MAIMEEAQSVGSIFDRAALSIADRMRVHRPPEKRARINHGPITMEESENVREAWLFAIRNDVPLNTFTSVHWGHAPAKVADLHPVDRNGLLRDGLKAWFYRHAPGVPLAWIEVREKTRAYGEHLHLVSYIPDHLGDLYAHAVDRLVARQSVSVTLKAVDVRPVGHRWWDRYAYLMKGGTDDVRERWLTREQRFKWSQGQGTLEGPRVRVAHSIGPTAREASESAAGGISDVSAAA